MFDEEIHALPTVIPADTAAALLNVGENFAPAFAPALARSGRLSRRSKPSIRSLIASVRKSHSDAPDQTRFSNNVSTSVTPRALWAIRSML